MRNFIEFIRSRGIIGFAVGFIMGKAVSDLVNSFVNDITNPIIGLLLGKLKNLNELSINVYSATIKYGNFLNFVINFFVIAFVVYFIFKVFGLEKLDEAKK
jgi:large conductance mechanosensitive channel